MKVATNPLVNKLLDELADSLKSLLGEKLTGLYLYGVACLRGLRPQHQRH